MKVQTELMKIGIGLHLPKPSTDKSEQSFIDWLFKYDFSSFGVSLHKVDGTNVCWVIGITFDIEEADRFSIRELQNKLQTEANKRLK